MLFTDEQIRMIPQFILRVSLHQASASTLRQLCDDTSDTVWIENNGVALEWGCSPFFNNSIVLNENSIHSTILELSHRDADARCTWALRTDEVKYFSWFEKYLNLLK